MQLIETNLEHDARSLLEEYGTIRSHFEIDTIYAETSKEEGSFEARFIEQNVSPIRVKDDDQIGLPSRLAQQWNLANWLMIRAYNDSEYLGGCLVAHDTDGVDMLEGRQDVSALWDIRVSHNHRGSGVGTLLFKRALGYSRRKGCSIMKIETQNINAKACKFYRKQGCELLSVKKNHYPKLPEEIQLIWRSVI